MLRKMALLAIPSLTLYAMQTRACEHNRSDESNRQRDSQDDKDNNEKQPTAVPEPDTRAMLSLGLAGMAGFNRRRVNKSLR